jgi:hypothetical protein
MFFAGDVRAAPSPALPATASAVGLGRENLAPVKREEGCAFWYGQVKEA